MERLQPLYRSAGTTVLLPYVRGNGTVRVTTEVDGYTP